MRILLSAYACEPNRGSEPGVGWNWVRHLAARSHEVWVLTRANNRENITRSLEQEPLKNVHFIYVDLPAAVRRWKHSLIGMAGYYCLWQIAAYFASRRLLETTTIDYVHHVTFVSLWRPCFVSLLPVPFVWGPVGGGEDGTPELLRPFGWRARVYEWTRSTARWLGCHDPFVRATARRCTVAFATTPESQRMLRKSGCRDVRVLSEAAIHGADAEYLAQVPVRHSGPFRAISVGRLIHWKGFEFSLRAFASVVARFPDSEYVIVGDGPERRRLEGIVGELGLSGNVRIAGFIPRSEVLAELAASDVLAHPSLHDSGGWACLEAMAAGRPVVCLDTGGPAVQVTPECGIRVPLGSAGAVVDAIANALIRLASDRELRLHMGASGRIRVQQVFNWNAKVASVEDLFVKEEDQHLEAAR